MHTDDSETTSRVVSGASRVRWVKLAVVVGSLAVICAGAAIWSSLGRHSNRAKCQKNLLAIGQSIVLYGHDHGGKFPARFDALITHADVAPAVFVCPHSTDTEASGLTTKAILDDFQKPGRCSYIYFGASLSHSTTTPQHVLAYEAIDKHEGIGASFLMGDFTVKWLDRERAALFIKQLQAGVNPPVP